MSSTVSVTCLVIWFIPPGDCAHLGRVIKAGQQFKGRITTGANDSSNGIRP